MIIACEQWMTCVIDSSLLPRPEAQICCWTAKGKPRIQQGPWFAILYWREEVSSSFLGHYDETQTLRKSQPQICAISADGGQIKSVLISSSIRSIDISKLNFGGFLGASETELRVSGTV